MVVLVKASISPSAGRLSVDQLVLPTSTVAHAESTSPTHVSVAGSTRSSRLSDKLLTNLRVKSCWRIWRLPPINRRSRASKLQHSNSQDLRDIVNSRKQGVCEPYGDEQPLIRIAYVPNWDEFTIIGRRKTGSIKSEKFADYQIFLPENFFHQSCGRGAFHACENVRLQFDVVKLNWRKIEIAAARWHCSGVE